MATLEEALLLEIPEILETGRLRLQATRAGGGAAINAAFIESFKQLQPWMPWAKNEPQSQEEKVKLLRTFRGRFDLGEEFGDAFEEGFSADDADLRVYGRLPCQVFAAAEADFEPGFACVREQGERLERAVRNRELGQQIVDTRHLSA